MSYSGQSNPPWQRNTLGNASQAAAANMQSISNQIGLQNPQMHYQNQSIFHQNMNMPQQSTANTTLSYSQQLTGNMNQMPPTPQPLFSQPISYPNPGSTNRLNPIAFSTNNQNAQASGPGGGSGGGSGAGTAGHGQHHQHQPHQHHQHHQQQQQQQQPQQHNQSSNYNTIGTVTKIHNDCGFVDDEVFFHKSVCKGGIPKIGDRVLVEAGFNQNTPFKWTATRVQIVPSPATNVAMPGAGTNLQRSQPPPLMSTPIKAGGGSSGYNAVPPPNDYARTMSQQRRLSPRKSPDRHSSRKDPRHRDDDEYDRKRRRDDRDRDRDRDRGRDKRDVTPDRRERSPIRRLSPKRRRMRAAPRYLVQIPKYLLTVREADVLELRRRYVNMYIPSDFFFSNIRWPDAFLPSSPYSIERPCHFHVMHKSVDNPLEKLEDKVNDPPDADYLFSAKVMLMGVPSVTDIYQKCLYDDKDRDSERDHVHPTRLINFLVGIRGKNETMAIGGPWSPSLDGAHPESDPSVLIKTAIRTCKTLTGIDLSRCTQWYRFVELYYHRAESTYKGKTIPARVETVVIFLPDINSCVPTRIEWDNLHRIYRATLDRIVNSPNDDDGSSNVDSNINNNTSKSSEMTSSSPSGATTLVPTGNDSTTTGGSAQVGDINEQTGTSFSATNQTNLNPISSTTKTDNSTGNQADSNNDDLRQQPSGREKDEVVKKEPTHYSELDLKSMKIQELRDELTARNLPAKGLKPQLVARLQKALNTEKSEEENLQSEEGNIESSTETKPSEVEETQCSEENDQPEEIEVDMKDILILDEYDANKPSDEIPKKELPRKLDEKERQQLERRYQLPESPHIIVHPSSVAKSGKFDCTVMSLSVLLDYRLEDTKERSFEVSIFAELFNEMLMRDFGFNIYKEIALIPESTGHKDELKNKDEKGPVATGTSTVHGSNVSPMEIENDEKSKDGISLESKRTPNTGESTERDQETRPRERRTSEGDRADKRRSSKDKERDRERDRDRERERDRDKDRDRERKLSKKSCDEDTEDDNYSIKSGVRRRKSKTFVARPDLLLSFIYFDTSHCGYIYEKDLEELFYIIGLNLSRGQVKKLLSKIASRDAIQYRKFTDKNKDNEEQETNSSTTGTGEESEKKNNESSSNNLVQLARGNRAFLPVFPNFCAPRLSEDNLSSSKENKIDENDGMVMYNGGLINIGNLIEQMKRSEKAREEMEIILTDLRKHNTDLQSTNSRTNNKLKDLQAEMKSLNKKLSESEHTISSLNKKYNEQYSILSSVYDRISPIFSKSERNAKAESSRDREKDRDRDKDKDDNKDSIKAEIKKE